MMDKIVFQPIMDGIKRKLVINSNVAGYKHTEQYGIHFFRRGKIGYMFDTNLEAVAMKKIDYVNDKYLPITYEEVRKFICIEI